MLLPIGLSLASEVKQQIMLSSAVLHSLNCIRHCSTETKELQITRQRFRTVQQAVTPAKDLPAPQGSTMTPERARPSSSKRRRWWWLRWQLQINKGRLQATKQAFNTVGATEKKRELAHW